MNGVFFSQKIEEKKNIGNIYKKHDLIFSKIPNDITELELKMINIIYLVIQKEIMNYKEAPTNHHTITISIKDLKTNLRLCTNSKKYIYTIEDTLTKLQNRKIKLHNFIHPKDEKIYNWYSTSLILQHSKSKFSRDIEILIDNIFVVTCWRKIKYTKLDINIISDFKSKYSIRLYEVLKTFEKYRKNVDINLEMLNTIFLKDNNKYISKIVDIINRNNVYNEINSVLPFSYEVHKQDKIITFNFSRKDKE